MIVFEQARKLWFQCGLEVENLSSTKSILFKKLNKLLIFGSQGLFLSLSVIYALQHVSEMQSDEIAYVVLQAQWGLLSVSLLVSIHLVEGKIAKMLENCQNLVEKSILVRGTSARFVWYQFSCFRINGRNRRNLLKCGKKNLFNNAMAEIYTPMFLSDQSNIRICSQFIPRLQKRKVWADETLLYGEFIVRSFM